VTPVNFLEFLLKEDLELLTESETLALGEVQ